MCRKRGVSREQGWTFRKENPSRVSTCFVNVRLAKTNYYAPVRAVATSVPAQPFFFSSPRRVERSRTPRPPPRTSPRAGTARTGLLTRRRVSKGRVVWAVSAAVPAVPAARAAPPWFPLQKRAETRRRRPRSLVFATRFSAPRHFQRSTRWPNRFSSNGSGSS